MANAAEEAAQAKIAAEKAEQAEAARRDEDHSGWFYRFILRSRYNDAKHDAWAADKNLEHARDRWRQDIRALYAKAPQRVLDEQLAARGLSDGAVNTGEAQERGQIEAEQAKAERENQALIEAEGSAEATARLDGLVSAKTAAQKQKAAAVHTRAEAYKAKHAARKQAEQHDEREKETERERKAVEKRQAQAQAQAQEEREREDAPSSLDLQREQVARDMAEQRAELEADEQRLAEKLDMPEFDSDEERQLWLDMREQRQEIDRDEEGLEHD